MEDEVCTCGTALCLFNHLDVVNSSGEIREAYARCARTIVKYRVFLYSRLNGKRSLCLTIVRAHLNPLLK